MTLPTLPKGIGFLSRLSYGKRIRPIRDWSTILVVFVIALLLSAGWNAWLFQHTNEQSVESAARTPVNRGLSPETLAQVQRVFDMRATEEERFSSTYHFPDPSVQ